MAEFKKGNGKGNTKIYAEPVITDRDIAGTIKFFNKEKGYGFIKNEGDDVFFHARSFADKSAVEKIKDGMSVTFDVAQSDKGNKEQAANIRFN